MPVGTQVKTALSNLKSAQADLENFALSTQDQQAKKLFTNAAQQTDQIVSDLEDRVTQIENEEPQYKGY